MRILLVSQRFPPDDWGGVERIVEMLAAQLIEGGDDVTIAVRRWGTAAKSATPQTVSEQLHDGTPLIRYSGGDVRLERFLDHHERLEQLFTQTLLDFAPDVVHVHHLIGLSPRFIEIAHRHGAAVVVSLQDFYFACPLVRLEKRSGELCGGPDGGRECARTCFAHEGDGARLRWGLRTSYFRRLLSMAERVVCPSEYVASYFAEFGADRARIRVVPNGVTLEPRPATPEPNGARTDTTALRLAFLGAVVPHKGLHVLLEALRLAELPSVRLAAFGQNPNPDYARSLRQRADAIPGLGFQLHGRYDPPQLPGLLNDVDLVIVPSQWPETFAIVTWEALVLGIPVIVARLGALPDAVVEEVNGFTFTHDRPEELASILTRLSQDQVLADRLREGAQRTPVVSATEHARAIRGVYTEAIDDLAQGGATRWGDLEELDFLHWALLNHGFGAQAKTAGHVAGGAARGRTTGRQRS